MQRDALGYRVLDGGRGVLIGAAARAAGDLHGEQPFGGAANAAHVALELRVEHAVGGREQGAGGREHATLGLPQRVDQAADLRAADGGARGRDALVDALQHVAAGLQRRRQRLALGRRLGVLEQHLAVADDQVERGAQLVAQLRDRLGRGESVHPAGLSRALILPSRRSSSTGLVS